MTTTTTEPTTTAPCRTEPAQTEKSTRTEEVLHRLTTGIAELTTSQAWTAWLRVQARFSEYSFGNSLLIALQAPEATHVAGYRTWAELGRQVRTGEKALWILAPLTRRRKETGADSPAANGTATAPAAHPADPTEPRRRGEVFGFKAVPVFDMAQTEGADLPEITRRLTGAAPGRALYDLTRIAGDLGYRVTFQPLGGGRNGECSFFERRINIENRNSPVQQVKTLAHEIAHAVLHHPDQNGPIERERCECEAESVAYIICTALGIDSGDYSFGYIAGWAGGGDAALREIRAGAERVRAAANQVLSALEQDG